MEQSDGQGVAGNILDHPSLDDVVTLLETRLSQLSRRIFLGMVAVGLGGGVYLGSGQLRPDPFTGTDFQLEKAQMIGEVQSMIFTEVSRHSSAHAKDAKLDQAQMRSEMHTLLEEELGQCGKVHHSFDKRLDKIEWQLERLRMGP